MLINPNALSSLDQSKLYLRAQKKMEDTDDILTVVKLADGKEIDNLPAADDVSFSNEVKLGREMSVLLKDGSLHFSSLEGSGSRIQEGDSTIYDYKSKDVKTRIARNNTSGNISFTEKREILGGLLSWNIVS